jgi:dTMP kinase
VARGKFITLEGGEGVGKSTQARRLAERLTAAGRRVVVTREPGGSPGAEAIREMLVHGAVDRWSPVTETLLMYAARNDHIERVIAPALDGGAWVVCDRFLDSTRAYQGAAGHAPYELIAALETTVIGGLIPDLTLILDMAPEVRRSGSKPRARPSTSASAKPSSRSPPPSRAAALFWRRSATLIRWPRGSGLR